MNKLWNQYMESCRDYTHGNYTTMQFNYTQKVFFRAFRLKAISDKK